MSEPLSAERLAEIRDYLEGCKGADLAEVPAGLKRYETWLMDADGRAVMLLAEVDRLTAEVERLRANAHAMSTAHRENWRRLFLDGGGNLFVDVCTDTDGTILVAPCHPDSFGDEQPLEALEAEHGILTQIGLVS